MYVEKIVADEFRCFQHAEIEFNYPGKPPKPGARGPLRSDNVTLLLGNNGSGKSAVLRAIVLGALARIIPSSGLRAYMFVRRAEGAMPPTKTASVTAHVVLHPQDGVSIFDPQPVVRISQAIIQLVQTTESFISTAVTDEDSWQPIYDQQSAAFFIAGYGATRRSDGSAQSESASLKSRDIRYQRVAGIFEDQVPLLSTSAALARLQSSPYRDDALNILNSLLPSEVQFDLFGVNPDGEFKVGSVSLPSTELSDGYRAFVAWTLDLITNLASIASPNLPLNEVTGTVLVDEIDLHLHPSWQRVVVDKIAKAFPKLQFIITSHSPLVTGSLEAGNILFADDTHNFAVSETSVLGLSSDQILTSPFFGLPSPRSVEATNQLTELARQAWEGDDKEASLRFLDMLTKGVEASQRESE